MIYHRDKGFPRAFREPTRRYKMVYTNHAKEQAILRNIATKNVIDFSNVVIIEVGYDDNGKINHYLARTVYNEFEDISFALVPDPRGYMVVKSLWLNDYDDFHRTLDFSRYSTHER